VARPRLVLGLDPFGSEVLHDAPLPPDVVVEPASNWDDLDLLMDRALASTVWSDAQAIEPVVIAVADLGSPAAGEIASGLGAALERALRVQIVFSAMLVLRLLERGPERADPALVIEHARALVTSLLANGQPGHGRVTVIVLPNRDGAGRVFQPDECTQMARHLVALLADPRAGDDPRLRRALAPLPAGFGEVDDPWGETAAFAAASLRRVVYPVADATAARTHAALAWLKPELSAHPPSSWEPRVPTLGPAGLEMDTRFGQAGLPIWEPDPWRSLAAEIDRARVIMRDWSASTREWDVEQRARVATRCLALTDEGENILDAWREQARADLAGVLGDQSLPGLWQSLRRWQTAALAAVPAPPVPPVVPDAPGDPVILEARVIATVGRRTNVRAVLIAAGTTLLTAGGLILAANELGAVVPRVALAWRVATQVLALPGAAFTWALGALILSIMLLSWLLVFGARLRSERAWERDVHIPARQWIVRSAAHHRAILRAHATQVQADLVHRASRDLQELNTRIDALQAAMTETSAVGSDSSDLELEGRFARHLTPTPPSLPPADPRTSVHALRAHPSLPAWLTSGDATDAAAIRDKLLQEVALAGDVSLAGDPAALAAAVALLPPASGDPRRAVSLKPRLLATPRWSVSEFLAAPQAAATDPSLLAHGAALLAGEENQIVALTLVTGLTAADLFGAATETAQINLREGIA
jgi:hypothetical protein